MNMYAKRLIIAAVVFACLTLNLSAAEWRQPDKVQQVLRGELEVADASWWGFDPKDSTSYLQAAFDSGASKIIVPKMASHWVVEPLFIRRDNLEVVFEEGVVVEAKRGAFLKKWDCLLNMQNRSNIVLKGDGAIFLMHREDYLNEPYASSEWRHALAIRGCTGVLVEGLTFRGSGGDGIYLGTSKEHPYVKDVILRRVDCDSNTRQGLSVISAENLLVENSVFRNTAGKNPGAGIDLEPNNERERMINVVIRNNLFENNWLGMHMWFSKLRKESLPVSVLWENNVARNHMGKGGIGIHVGHVGDDCADGVVRFVGNTVENTAHAGIHFRNKSSAAMRFIFEDTVLINTALNGTKSLDAPISAPIVLHARNTRSLIPGGIEFNNITITGECSEAPGPVIHIGSNSRPWGIVWKDVSGNIRSDLKRRSGIKVLSVEQEGVNLQLEESKT